MQLQWWYWLALGGFALNLVGFSWWLMRHRPQRHLQPKFLTQTLIVPTVSPALAQAVFQQSAPNIKGLTGEILQAISLSELQVVSTADDLELVRLKPVSNAFLATCFEQIAQGNRLSLAALKAYGKQDRTGKLVIWFSHWRFSVSDQLSPYQDANNARVRKVWLNFAVMLSIWLVITFYAGCFVAIMTGIVTGLRLLPVVIIIWVLALIQRARIKVETDAGLALHAQLKVLRERLAKIDQVSTVTVGDLSVWEQVLPYAAAFGMSKRVTAKLASDFGTDAISDMQKTLPLLGTSASLGIDLATLIQKSISLALEHSDAKVNHRIG